MMIQSFQNAVILLLFYAALVDATICQCICKDSYSIITFPTCSPAVCFNSINGAKNGCEVADFHAKDLTGVIAGGVVGGMMGLCVLLL
ncbi:hypothetical protein HDU98_001183 [Podochytrium sp. JEL0797]|nr:hypothetical protein HDU98_001183 [Podochytrium sp. JEL0797]